MKLKDFVNEEDQKPLEGKFKRMLDFIKKEVELEGSEAVAKEIRELNESNGTFR